ncbi:L,D-transpeptidase family protein [Microlunatus sp. Gsoil 973]|uniref:L,D-transpeptidase family protein n=1 Tax=Microlunatus sp. Gsoil 973 TaxID=2672569 RepID=UPI001E557BDE|nr:L,D-transpeptidase family protein [Microlunatus sp. Gsoil 973]
MSRLGARRPGFIRTALAGLLAMGLAVGLLLGSQSTAEASSKYVTTKYQKAHYGQDNAKVTNIQLRLAAGGFMKDKYVTGYYGDITKNAVKSFRKSVHLKPTSGKKMTKKTWRALVKATGKVKRAGSHRSTSSGVIDKRCLTGHRVLCVNETTSKLYYVNHNKVIKTMDARFGCGGTTREGVFSVFRKVRHDWSRPYNSPMPLSMYFSGGEAVHYSADFAARGYAGCSHGCVNIRDRKTLRWVYKRIHIGDRVVVYFS